MVHKLVVLHCTQCSREYHERDESVRALRSYAKKEGWVYKKVENGSYWDFCPKCVERNKEND